MGLSDIRAWLKKLAYLLSALLTGFAPPKDGEVAVLMYHAIDDSGWRLSVTPKQFERQMARLRRHHVVVPLADIVAHAKGEKRLPARAVAVTFDDGYADLIPVVLPVLKKYRVPMTLFLNTDVSVQTNSLGTPRVTWDDIRVLVESGFVSIESHGKTHAHLPALEPSVARAELVDAVDDIRVHLGTTPSFFAYPFGDRSLEVEAMVEEVGYTAAFGISEGFIAEQAPLYRLPRIQVDATMTPLLFALRLTPALAMHRRIVGAFRRVLEKHTK